jgi:hypothetical protein
MICGKDALRKSGYAKIDPINLQGRQFATQFPTRCLHLWTRVAKK